MDALSSSPWPRLELMGTDTSGGGGLPAGTAAPPFTHFRPMTNGPRCSHRQAPQGRDSVRERWYLVKLRRLLTQPACQAPRQLISLLVSLPLDKGFRPLDLGLTPAAMGLDLAVGVLDLTHFLLQQSFCNPPEVRVAALRRSKAGGDSRLRRVDHVFAVPAV